MTSLQHWPLHMLKQGILSWWYVVHTPPTCEELSSCFIHQAFLTCSTVHHYHKSFYFLKANVWYNLRPVRKNKECISNWRTCLPRFPCCLFPFASKAWCRITTCYCVEHGKRSAFEWSKAVCYLMDRNIAKVFWGSKSHIKCLCCLHFIKEADS